MSSPQEIAIPAAISIPTDSLLLKLLEACAKHKRHHEADNETSDFDGRCGDGDNNNDRATEMDKVCENALSSLANILPRMENTITVPDTRMDVYFTSVNDTAHSKRSERNNKGEDIHHLCALYRAIARSSFCPHACSFLLDNHTISSRMVRLLGYLVMDPVGAAEVGDTAVEVGNAIEAMLDANEKLKRGVLSDLILLVDDLNTVDESGVMVNPNGAAKITIHILSSMGSNNTIELVSKRSLLSLQLGVWSILRACIPSIDYTFVGKLSHGEYVDINGTVDEIIAAASRCALLAGKGNDEGETNIYSTEDLRIHSRLICKTKMIISGMLQSITGGNLSHFGDTSSYSAQLINPPPRSITVALLAVEAAKSHLKWNQDNFNDTDSTELYSKCSQSLAKFMLSTLSTPRICTHSLPYIVDLLPYLVNQQDSTLPRVVLRILHSYLLQYDQATVLLKRRCLAQCYFPFLFQLTCDSECLADVAVSIIQNLINKSRDEWKLFAFADLPAGSTCETEMEEREQALVQGRKRRRIINGTSSHSCVIQGASIYSTLAHFVVNAIAKADNLISSIDARVNKCSPVTSPIIAEDVPNVKVVSGILRILLSLPTSIEGADGAIRRLFSCIHTISQTLVSHEQKSNCYIEPKTLRMCLELIVSVGFHAYSRGEHMQSVYRTERESISHCAVATQPLIDSDEVIEIDDETEIELLTHSRSGICCQGACSRLCSVIGVKATPPSDICICSLGSETRNDECSEFLVRDLLPLKFRCILLASLSPVTADSNYHDTSLTSIQHILADPLTPQDLISASLISLPILLHSIASSKEDQSISTRYLLSLLESFDYELITRHCRSEIKRIQASALLSISRLLQMYTAVSIVSSKEDCSLTEQLRSEVAAFLWDKMNPSVSGTHEVLLGMIRFDNPLLKLSMGTDIPSSLLLLPSDNFILPLVHESHHVFLAAHTYLQSTLSVGSMSTLLSFGGFEFLSAREHYLYLEELAQSVRQGTECNPKTLTRVPFSVWAILSPFVAVDPSISKDVAKGFGHILLDNYKIFSTLFMPEDELNSGVTIKAKAVGAVQQFFREIECLLITFFGLPRDLVTIGECNSSLDDQIMNEHGLEISVCLFQSLCQAAPLDSIIGVYVFKQSLLRLTRIWVGGTSTKYTVTEYFITAFSAACDAIKGLFSERGNNLNDLFFKSDDFAASIFKEFFLPSVKDSIPWSRYQLLVEFIESCLLPNLPTQGLPANGLDVPNNLEVGGFIDRVYPSVIASMIFNEDNAGLEMCAAFRMYIVDQRKTQKRAQKKSGMEFIVGKHTHRKISERDLVAGVQISGSAVSAKSLTENMKMLCFKSDVIEYVLPRLLLHSDRSVLKFFADLCPKNTSLSQIVQEKERTVLKTLVWELGADDPDDRADEIYTPLSAGKGNTRNNVILALKMGYLIKEGSASTAEVDDVTAVSNWIGPNFMHLLVNVVLYRWNARSDREKFQTVKCLKALLKFLSPADSLQFMPQIMVAISNAMGSNEASNGKESKLQSIAVATLHDFVKILASQQLSSVSENLTSIVVILFPLFDKEVPQYDVAREEAVKLLEWLADLTSESFNEIPFLPITPDLQTVRDTLAKKGVSLDDIRLVSQQTDLEENASITNPQLQSKFYAQMNVLSDLIANHENKTVRKVVILHMTKLIRSNRDLFSDMIENEGLASMQYLTVVHEEGGGTDGKDSVNGGFITKLLMRLLSKCVDESDRDIRDAIARCLGEIGAIDTNRLGKEITASQFHTENNDSDDWRLNQPPWKSNVTRYQLRLVTRHLVSGLKSAATIIDQHKLSFGIQELLKQIDASYNVGMPGGGASSSSEDKPEQKQREMSSWLKEKLDEADVRCIVEPFWTSIYQQQDLSAEKQPPYFVKSNSYFRWLSSFCRFLVTRSHANERSLWSKFFYACRSAIRSQAGISVAEFILPVIVLDTVCFGEKDDLDVIVSEFLEVLSFDIENLPALMNSREREKAVNSVFTLLDVLRHWAEREMEQLQISPKSKAKRRSRNSRNSDQTLDIWPVEESISKINQFLKRIPSSICAVAASSVGMTARSLRFLEIESRSKCGLHTANMETKQGLGYLKFQYLDGIDLDLTHDLLGKLNDYDTMVIISQKGQRYQSSLTRRLAQDASERELCGDIEGACQAYEQLLDTRLNKEEVVDNTRLMAQQGLLRCQLKLGRLDSVVNQAYGMTSSSNRAEETVISNMFIPFAAEAAWRLGNWSVLDEVSHANLTENVHDVNGHHQLCLSRVMDSLHSRCPSKFNSSLLDARESAMTALSSAARDSYSQSYPYLMQLHALRDIERVSSDFFDGSSNKNREVLSDEWSHRLNLSSPDSTGSNVILNTRLALCRMADEPIAEGLLWLDIGKQARKGGLYSIAEQSLTHADVAFSSSVATSDIARESIGKVKLQFAKLKYATGEPTTALNLIEDCIPSSILYLKDKELQSLGSHPEQSVDNIGRLLLQATEWMVSGGLKSGSDIRSRYETVLKLVPQWERAHFHFAKYLDMLFESSIAKSTGQTGHDVDNNASRANAIGSDEKCQKLLIESINHYGIALQLGQKHIFQALPRLLAMWLEFTAIDNSNKSEILFQSQSEVNILIKSFISKIPEHVLYTALPQLVSCILHSNQDSSKNVMQILVAVLSKYPCQTVWACNWLRFSRSPEKKKAGNDIFHGAKKVLLKMNNGKQLQGMLDSSKDLYIFLLQLARYVPKNNATSIKMVEPKFQVPLTHFIPPIQSALSVTPGALDRSDVNEVFPQFVPRMRAFNPEVKVMQSKAKPKRMSTFAVPATATDRVACCDKNDDQTIYDTGEMHFLVKQEAKGDLRKDSRVQDLNNVINRLFLSRKASSGSDSRRKRLRLHLRTFSVVCLSEDCGVLEWVPNTDSFRSLVGSSYNPQVPPNSIHRRGDRITNYNNVELRDAFLKCQDMYFKKGDLSGGAKKFEENILQQYRPFMYWWFIQNFPNPHAWFEARNNFTLSTAVWSAVGHVIGLGDRHSENILVDTRSGECVHVDFDCIFDKGLLLPRPEVVPFRLTPNMIDAFGPTGAEGLYTGALVESMKTLRQNRDTLLSVLEPFLKDPVINFSSSKNQQKAQTASAKAVDAIRKIDGRLKGMYNLKNPNYRKIARRDGVSQEEDDDSAHVSLSVEGQVQRMIAEATSHENLVQVYVGWMPWI